MIITLLDVLRKTSPDFFSQVEELNKKLNSPTYQDRVIALEEAVAELALNQTNEV